MTRPLRVLLVEDSADDADLLLAELRRHDYAPQVERVETAAAMRRAFEAGTWDVVVSDYRLPRFSGTKALELTRQLAGDLPFIMVSGTVGEETAVAALKAGAHDFVTKDNLSRLCPAIEREMREAANRKELRRTGELLLRSEQRFRALIEQSTDLVMVLAADGRITYLSPTARQELGYAPEQLVGKVAFEQLHPEDVTRVQETLGRALGREGAAIREEVRVRHADGSWRTFQSVVTNLLHDPAVAGFVVHSRDVTDERAAEASLRWERFLMTTLLETLPDAIYFKDRDSRILRANRAMAEHSGLQDPSEVVGKTDFDLFAPEHARAAFEDEQRIVRTGESMVNKEELESWPGRPDAWVSTTKMPLRDASGAIIGTFGVSRDITERRQAEELLRRSEAEFRGLVEHAPLGIYRATPEGRFISVNPALVHMLGYETAAQVCALEIGRDVYADPGERGRVVARFADETEVAGETRWTRRDGRQIRVRLLVREVRDASGRLEGYEGTVEDVTELRRQEEALRESEQRLRSVFDRMQLIGLELDVHARITYCNDYFLSLTGWRREEALGADYLATFLPPGSPALAVFDAAMATGEAPAHFRNPIRTRQGALREIEWSNTLLHESGGRVTGVVSIGQDITDREQALRELRRSEEDFRGLIEHASVGIFRATPEGRFVIVNPALVRMLGYGWPEELLRLDVAQDVYADPAARAEIVAALARSGEAEAEVEWKRKDGGRLVVRLREHTVKGPGAGIEYFEGTASDVTQQRTLEAQFRQAQRLEAVGRLAGGVAHDFNNVLTAITGYAELLLEDLGPEDPKRPDVEEIKAAAARASALTRQLLAFSRKQVLQTRVLDVNEVVRTLEKMLRRLIGEDVRLELALAPSVRAVRADPGQLEQVILNLAVNSRDAMPHGGRLTIESGDVELDEAYARAHPGAAPGRYVMLAVADTGTGMDAEIQAHIFEPFFTTKEQGKGTGLGLATVYGIIKQSGGSVWVYSEPGRGTTFKIYLPRVDEAVAGEPLAQVEPEAVGGKETVLVAEDDPSVRAVVADVLTQKGYRVLRAPDGQAALEMAGSHPGAIDLLVTDIVMPGMTGRELAEALAAARPGVLLLYMSGYTDDAVVRHGVLEAGVPYIQKPFTPSALAAKVRAVLDRRPA